MLMMRLTKSWKNKGANQGGDGGEGANQGGDVGKGANQGGGGGEGAEDGVYIFLGDE